MILRFLINKTSKIRIPNFAISFFSKVVQWYIEHYSTEATNRQYEANSNGTCCFRGYCHYLNFLCIRFILPINQIEIKPCLLINELKNLNQTSNGCIWVFHKILTNQQYRSNISGVRISVTCQIQVNSYAFRFSRHPTSIESVVSS